MNIEPLHSILSISSDKKNTLLYFLSDDLKLKLHNFNYENNNFFINDYIHCITKNTLELKYSGRIFLIEKNKIGIKKSTYMNLYFNKTLPNDLKNKLEYK